jgi:hypothetical protein
LPFGKPAACSRRIKIYILKMPIRAQF